jgi:hypothetical protein
MVHKNLATESGDISNMFVDMSITPSAYNYMWEGKGRRIVRSILNFLKYLRDIF